MRLRLRNCVNDPVYEHLRVKGTPVNEPVISGLPLPPFSIRTVEISELTTADVKFLDFLIKNGSVEVVELGFGLLTSADRVKSFMGIEDEVPPIPEELEIAAPLIKVAEVTDEIIKEDEEDSVGEESLYTEEALLKLKNSELRSILKSLDSSISSKNKSKKALVGLILGAQNG